MSQINTLFISYRRADNPIFVERIRDWLIARYQRDRVFMDFDSIPSFTRFQTFIEKKIAASDAVIVIIGPQWLKLLKEKESSGEIDYVRIEIEAALKLNKVIAPIRILDAPAPRPADLPLSLRPLCEINAPVLNSGTHFLDNIERLIADLEAAYAEANAPAPPAASTPTPSAAPPASPTSIPTSKPPALRLPFLTTITAEGHFERASKNFRGGNYSAAIRDATEAIRLKPDFAEAYTRRSEALVSIGDYDSAIVDAVEALRIKPDSIDALNSRGIARLHKGDLDDAIADFNEAIRLEPDHVDAYINRAFARSEKSEYRFAAEDWTEVIRLKPNYSDAYANRSAAHAEQGDYESAVADMTEAIRLTPKNPDGYASRGILRELQGDSKGAITDWREAIRLGSTRRSEIEEWITYAEKKFYRRK